MKTKEFIEKHSACSDGAEWALSVSEDMADVWDAMIKQGKHDWLLWTATRPEVFPDTVLRKLACRVVRETPLHDGRKVWDLLTDERSRKAVEVAEACVDGKATYEELDAAYTAARAAAYAAYYDGYAAARDVAHAAARAARAAAARDVVASSAAYDAVYAANYAVYAAAHADAYTAAKAAQVQMIVEMGNPFKERAGK